MKKFLNLVIASIVGSALTIGVFVFSGIGKNNAPFIYSGNSIPGKNAVYTVNENGKLAPLEFTSVSKNVMNAVVHIKVAKKVPMGKNYYGPQQMPFDDDIFKFFFGEPQQPQRPKQQKDEESYMQMGSGSGIIINPDGYIVTNNHVIDGADEIEVSLADNEVYKAKVIGTDPSTDIALLQIKKTGLEFIPFGNSDEVEVGQWVLAVGNPFDLNSTVTAGIISAKGRNINIINDKSAIEAFIQTDAAINPGNSGGALVNLNGELIGMNTAIASPTGTYAGYGFAIPTNIVSKVVTDIMKFGMVQRAYLGVTIRDFDGTFADKNNLTTTEGVYVDSLVAKSAAGEAGILAGDVIKSIDGHTTRKSSDVLEIIGQHHPGDKVSVVVNRKGKEFTYEVMLANNKGEKKILEKEEEDIFEVLGASFETLDKKTADKLGIEGGVKVKELENGVLKSQTNIKPGFIITGVNNTKVTTAEDLKKVFQNIHGGVMISGTYENYPGEIYYAFGMK
jgi:Do/DeqQ family serine protease